MQHIADALSIRKRSPYKHFVSKDSLYGAVLEQALSPLFAARLDDITVSRRRYTAVRYFSRESIKGC